MPTLRLTKEFRFEGAHALTGYDGKCRETPNTHEIDWQNFLNPISALCIIFLKAKELSGLECLDDLG